MSDIDDVNNNSDVTHDYLIDKYMLLTTTTTIQRAQLHNAEKGR